MIKRSIFTLIFSITLFITGCSTDITVGKVFNEFAVDKTIAEKQYSKLSNSDKEVVDNYIEEEMNNIYKSFINNDLSLSEAFVSLSCYNGIEAVSDDLEKFKDEMAIISESKTNYMKAEEELTKNITYITLENAINFYEEVDPVSEFYLDSQDKIISLNYELLGLSKNSKISNIEDKDLLEFFQSTDPDSIIREYDIGFVKEKYIYNNDKYLIFENEILIDENIN